MRGLHLLTVVVVLVVAQLALAASSRGNAKAGEKMYVEGCQICHGLTGKGDRDMAPYLTPLPDLSAKRTQEKTDAELRRIIVKGHGTYMWSYGGAFDDDQLRDIIAYIRSLKP